MAKKKDFKGSPAMSFISQESIERVDGKQKRASTPTGKAPEGYRANPAFIENKSKRVQLLIQPSLHEQAGKVAEELGISLNDFIHRAIYEATHNSKIKEKIRKDLER